MSQEEPLLIVGSGALACLFAARLSAAGVPVIMLGSWVEGVSALQKQGVRLQEGGKVSRHAVRATLQPTEVGLVRQALVLRKSWQTRQAAADLRNCLAPNGVALTLQNGIGNVEILEKVVGRSRVSVGVTTTPARLVCAGVVAATGTGTITVEDRSATAPLVAILQKAHFTVRRCPQMESLLWGKLVISAAINPLTALLRIKNGQLLQMPVERDLAFAVGREAAELAKRLSISLPYPDPDAAIEAVLRETAENHSSMLQDILRGAPTEVDSVCGAIHRAGRQAGMSTPLNSALHHLVKSCCENSKSSELMVS